jgi:hypothetical protein
MTHIPANLRRIVEERAKLRCEYCLIHQEDYYWSFEIDHIYAEKHGGDTLEANLCLSCADCNRNKGTDLASLDPATNEPAFLFHPRRQMWKSHFQVQDGFIMGLTAERRTTAYLLRVNASAQVAERRRLIALNRYLF